VEGDDHGEAYTATEWGVGLSLEILIPQDTEEASNKAEYNSAAESAEGRRPVGEKASSNACSGLRAGISMSLTR
jgi:hypothetical protein